MVMASMQAELVRIIYAGSSFLHLILIHSSKEGLDHTVQYWPGSSLDGLVRFGPNASGLDPVWMAWSGLGQMHLVW